ncbi:MAG: hypothetical protein V1799_10215 [bacterium]
MDNFLSDVLQHYGGVSFLVVSLGAVVIWALAHWAASPGTEVSILWGLVKYTKPNHGEHKNSGFPTPPALDVTSLKVKSFLPLPVLPQIALLVNSSLTLKTSEKALSKIRKQCKLRELNTFETGKPISKLPHGTYFFVNGWSITGDSAKIVKTALLESKCERIASSINKFEVHYISDGMFYLVCFLSNAEAAKISQLSGDTLVSIVAFPRYQQDMTSLVIVPVDRIQSCNQRTLQLSKYDEVYILDIIMQ